MEKVKVFQFELSDLFDLFMNRQFVVKDRPGKFNAVSADMKLEQTIQRLQKKLKRHHRTNQEKPILSTVAISVSRNTGNMQCIP